MSILPIATASSLGGVRLDDDKDIKAEAGTISTKYNGLLSFERYSFLAGGGATGYTKCLTLGYSARTTSDGAIALGFKSQSLALGSIAVGTNTRVSDGGGYSVALGFNASANGSHSVALGFEADASEEYVVSVGSSTARRRVIYVKDAQEDYDAVNLGQLKRGLAEAGGGGLSLQMSILQERIVLLERQLCDLLNLDL
ncbi:hypothetical protein [Pseudomonas sp. PDM25]|uniref:hypothetical protein n=1 Tax=Pseudomonas sp. PDM25 TaxID=2854772 RepID=UPI001C46F071|nr:hypothetical protein [Pseudomonas sp. PDM25]MBV7515689.1 hypothetical protein [Pseudomonas sp. PDM25]